MTKVILMASVAALSLSLAGCDQTTTDRMASGASETANAAGTMASNAIDDVKQAVTPTPTGRAFVDQAGKSDAFEIASSKLAQTNATSKEVKDFAAEMIKAHTDSTSKIKAAAAKASPAITPDPTMTEDQRQKLAELGKKKGVEFDQAYIDGQVDAHRDALSLMRNYAENGDSAPLKMAASEIAPVVQKHLDHAKMLDK